VKTKDTVLSEKQKLTSERKKKNKSQYMPTPQAKTLSTLHVLKPSDLLNSRKIENN